MVSFIEGLLNGNNFILIIGFETEKNSCYLTIGDFVMVKLGIKFTFLIYNVELFCFVFLRKLEINKLFPVFLYRK